MINVKIRKAREDELKIVQGLNEELFLFDSSYDDALKMEWPYKEEGAQYFRSKISGKDGICLIAEVNGRVIGYLAGKLNNPVNYRLYKRAELETIFIKEGFRGRGVGTKLVKEFLKWAKENGTDRVFVSAYFYDDKASSFYKKMGIAPLDLYFEIKIK